MSTRTPARMLAILLLSATSTLAFLAPSGPASADGYCGTSARQTAVIRVYSTVKYHVWCTPFNYSKTCASGYRPGSSSEWKYGWIGNGMAAYLVFTKNNTCVYAGNAFLKDLATEWGPIVTQVCSKPVQFVNVVVGAAPAPPTVKVVQALYGTTCVIKG